MTILACTICGLDVDRSHFDRGPRRHWVHLDRHGSPVASDHRPDVGPRPSTTYSEAAR